MDRAALSALLSAVRSGDTSVEDALSRLEVLPFEDLGFVQIDHHRHLRKGFPEVVLGAGKTEAQLLAIGRRMSRDGWPVLFTRLAAVARAKLEKLPRAQGNAMAGTVLIRAKGREEPPRGNVLIVSAGTSDLPVAEEAAVTAEAMGSRVGRIFDVGVAGIHRLIARMKELREARVLVVVAGMEGALPSVVAGLVAAPVIAVPTSVGYGASFGGLAALLAMLNSCAAGVTVVNIDNGFGAGYAASQINRIAVHG
ncbi:MAG: nickel pincer cofactor biosynthesis protein LarB [Acidobacteriota bacterium]